MGSLSYDSVKTWTPDSKVAATVYIHQKVLVSGTMWLIAQLLSLDFGLVLSGTLEVGQPFRMHDNVGWEQWTCAQAGSE